MTKRPVMLMILDGFGATDKVEGNAVLAANKPNYDKIWSNYPHTYLNASGLDVGLPVGQMGNSEVGHLNIGSGRIIYQELTKITKEIEEGNFFKNDALNLAMDKAKENNSALHLLGLLSDGGVHSHVDHVKALLQMAKDKGLTKVYLHAFTDGRDVPPTSGIEIIADMERYMNDIGLGKIATISGRYYAMDRDNRWERIQLAYNAMVLGEGERAASGVQCVERSYKDNKKDEFILPCVIEKDEMPVGKITDNDSIIFFNFRPDRAREITRALNDKEFQGFPRSALNLTYVTMTQYDKTLEGVEVAYKPEIYTNTLGQYVSKCGKKQLRIAETEKYAHVTFFFNGGVEAPNEGEDRVLVLSPKVATYDLQPEMSAYEVTEKLIQKIDEDQYDMIILNFANPDMVGHTGIFEATKKAIEVIDECLGKISDKILEKNGSLFVTADHGNSEQMVEYGTKNPMTAHTTNKVPFIYISNNATPLREEGRLSDITPTILQAMGLEAPVEMTAESLII